MTSSSQIFCPYRAVGFCCNHVPLVAISQGSQSFVVTAVGNAFHVYLCDKLRLIFVGSLQPHPLQCLALQGKVVFASYRNIIKAFIRGREINSYLGHDGEVQILLPFGEHLCSIDDQNSLKIWHIRNNELYGELHFDEPSFQVTSALHPTTYLNKLLLGSHQGQLQLWNIRTSKLVYTFTGWGSPVLSLAQAPAVDVVGVGLEDGSIIMHNLKFDQTVVRFHQEWGPVIGISFRTDGVSTVCSASPRGHVAVWDLDRRRLGAIMRDAHNGAVCGLHFLSSQPVLLTSSPDNCLKMWIFDQSDGSARLLRSRCGHSAPPTKIRFLSANPARVLSAGLDNALRIFSIHKDVTTNAEMSQGSLMRKSKAKGVGVETLKLPSITDFALEETRVREWDSVVSCHMGHSSAHSWNLSSACIGKHALKSKHIGTGSKPQCVAMTGCGNFAILGMSTGHVEFYNVQSGIHRGEFGRPKAHSRAVRGVAVDALNMEVYSASSDGTVKFWSFHDKLLLDTLTLDAPVANILLHRPSSMLAVSCDDFSVVVVDTDTRRIVRKFQGHRNRITDMVFMPDGRWLISSAMDCSIRTWDLPSNRLIDCFLVESPPTSLSVSPSADFLASTHVDDLGIYLWSNRTLYSHVSLRPLPVNFEPTITELPTTGSDGIEEIEDLSMAEDVTASQSEMELPKDEEVTSTLPLAEGLVTLSTLPKSRWHNLQNLDIIKQRNKPIEPPKQPKQAPFFLPTLPGLQPKFIPTEENSDIPADDTGSRIISLTKLQPLSTFQKQLVQCGEDKQFDSLMDLLKTMPPAEIEGEFRSLAPEAGGSFEWLAYFMTFLLKQLQTHRNFELVQSYLGLFLKLHSLTIPQSSELQSLAEEILTEHQKTWSDIQHELNMSACLLAYCKSATI